MTSARDDFINLIYESGKAKGFDDLSSKIFAILYVEPHEISLDELSKQTGYSLSAISTSVKFMEAVGLVKRSKKPKSRKVYLFMEKNMFKKFMEIQKKHYENIITPSKQKMPDIIKKYKKEKSEKSREELEIAECYYKNLMIFEKIIKEHLNVFMDKYNLFGEKK